jgi:recombination protein RecT
MTTTAMVRQTVSGVREYLAKCKPALEQAIPETLRRVMTADRVLRVMNSSLTKTPALAQCSPQSLALAMMGSVQLGLEPGGALQHAHLIPFGSEVVLVIGYKGLLELARRTGEIASVKANVVREGDEFEYEDGLELTLRHRPRWRGALGDVVAAYCVIKLNGGGVQVDVMTRAEVDAIRMRSRAGGKGPWVTDFAEMAKKTVLKRCLKYAPQSTEMAEAMARDADGAVDEPDARTLREVVDVQLPDAETSALPTGHASAQLPAPHSRTAALKAQLGARGAGNGGQAKAAPPPSPHIEVERADGSQWNDAAPEEPPMAQDDEPGANG